jgi:hypothetical protein
MQVKRTGNIEKFQKALDELTRKQIKVGFFEGAKYPDGTPYAYIAAIQEFGSGPIPPRPFMRPAQEQNAGKWEKGIAAGLKAALGGGISIADALERVGMVAAGDVRKAIKAVTAPPLASATIAARQRRLKGKKSASVKPLVDTGQMIQAVTSAVVDK